MRIIYKKQFEKRFKVLGQKTKNQFYERLELFLKDKTDKILNNHDVGKAFPGCRSINITGDYRAIFQDDGDLVLFIIIGTHSELY